MEQAQNLRLGDPLSGEPEVVLDGILRLLGSFLTDVDLFILLASEKPLRWEGRRVCFAEGGGRPPPWLAMRAQGTSVWIPTWAGLPDDLKLALADQEEDEEVEAGTAARRFHAAAAVPLYEPPGLTAAPTPGPSEAGLLFLVARRPNSRTGLFGLGRRLSRFVTLRWQQQYEVNQRIHTDSLTGVNNRAFFDLQFSLELERAKRARSALSLVLADLDHFKQVNDTHGHPVGDEVLKLVARQLQGATRRIDHICRTGGEEFALILPDTDATAAREVVGRFFAGLDRLVVTAPDSGESVQVTLSFGVASFPEGGTDAFELYRKADAMLYLSKEMGRNRCHFWNQNGEPLALLPETPAG